MGSFPIGPGDDAGAVLRLDHNRAEHELEERETRWRSLRGKERKPHVLHRFALISLLLAHSPAHRGQRSKPSADTSLHGSSLQPSCSTAEHLDLKQTYPRAQGVPSLAKLFKH